MIRNNIMGLLGPGGNIFEKGMVNEYYNKIPMLDPKDPADIVKWNKLNEEDKMKILNDFDLLDVPYMIDIVFFNELQKQELITSINKEGIKYE